jgi:hypothetical protein
MIVILTRNNLSPGVVEQEFKDIDIYSFGPSIRNNVILISDVVQFMDTDGRVKMLKNRYE